MGNRFDMKKSNLHIKFLVLIVLLICFLILMIYIFATRPSSKEEYRPYISEVLELDYPYYNYTEFQVPFYYLTEIDKDMSVNIIKEHIHNTVSVEMDFFTSVITPYHGIERRLVHLTLTDIDEIKQSFIGTFDIKNAYIAYSCLLDTPYVQIKLLPSNITFCFFPGNERGLENAKLMICTDWHNYQRLEGVFAQDFIVQALSLPVADNKTKVWDAVGKNLWPCSTDDLPSENAASNAPTVLVQLRQEVRKAGGR